MARYAPQNYGREHIDRVADRWRRACLINDGSLLFDDRAIWLSENLDAFRRSFTAPDPAESGFVERFTKQFSGDSDEVKWIAAELSVVYCLLVTDMMGAKAKEALVRAPLGSLDPSTAPHWQVVASTFPEGVANPGAHYNVRRHLQYLYLVEVALLIKQLPIAEREAVLSDPWRTENLMDGPEGAQRLEMRHILLHLLHPDHFERVTSLEHKHKIVSAFAAEVEASGSGLEGSLDEQLLTVRTALEAANPGAVVDFYSEPWNTWRGSETVSDESSIPNGPRWWWVNQGKTYAAERDAGIMWAPLLSKNGLKLSHWERLVDVQPGDIVLHYSGALKAVSRVQTGAVNAPKPTSLISDAWAQAGRLVETEYVEFPQPIRLQDIPQAWREAEVDGPFTKSGAVKQAYLFGLSERLAADLSDRFDEIGRVAGTAGPAGPRETTLAEVYAAFAEAVADAGLLQPPDEDRVRNVLAAFVAKPFVILSGLSGSGKTQLGLRLGEWFGAGSRGSRSLVVAVRPDWTSPDALFGYEDLLQPRTKDGRPGWHVPETLEFMLRAAEDPEEPYLLLLDEMNLAHVERYFSDFLSGVESGKPVLPNLVQEDGTWRPRVEADAFRELPPNVFVMGTVNVDETTYQFSPKVLDRAFSFEVRTRSAELDPAVAKPTAVLEGDEQLRRALARLAQDVSWLEGHPHPAHGEIASALIRLHEVLADGEDEFGHRVLFEAMRFAAALNAAGETNPERALDQIVITKLLPRIHGGRRRVEPTLHRLQRFAVNPKRTPDQLRVHQDEEDGVLALPVSGRKIAQMLHRVRVDQFVSFSG